MRRPVAGAAGGKCPPQAEKFSAFLLLSPCARAVKRYCTPCAHSQSHRSVACRSRPLTCPVERARRSAAGRACTTSSNAVASMRNASDSCSAQALLQTKYCLLLLWRDCDDLAASTQRRTRRRGSGRAHTTAASGISMEQCSSRRGGESKCARERSERKSAKV